MAVSHVFEFQIIHSSDKVLEIQAEVAGSHASSYEVDVSVGMVKSKMVIYGDCSCPVGYNCKHVAAACFYYITEHVEKHVAHKGSENLVKQRSKGFKWLQKIKQSTPVNKAEVQPKDEFLHYYLEPNPNNDFHIKKHKILKNGKLSVGSSVKKDSFINGAYELMGLKQATDSEASDLLRGLEHRYYYDRFPIKGRLGYYFLKALAATGRCFYMAKNDKKPVQALKFNDQAQPLQFN